MTTNADSITIGIFQDQAQAQQAIDELRTAGFRDDQIRFDGHGTSPGGLLASLRSLFSGHGVRSGAAYEDLVSLGVPEEEARSYQQEYEAGRSIVAVTAENRLPEAADILARSGASVATTPAAQTAAESAPLAQTADAAGTTRVTDTDATHTPGPTGMTRVAHTDETHTPDSAGTTDVAQTDASHAPDSAGTTDVTQTDASHTPDSAGTTDVTQRGASHTPDSAAAPSTAQESVADAQGEQRMQLREEQLQVQKHWVATTYVLIRKRVITEEKTFKVMVAREEVVIERYPSPEQAAGIPLNPEQLTSQGETQLLQLAVGQTIRIPLREEAVHLEKRPVVVEEVVIEKQALQETRQVSALVEREVPRIQRTGTAPVQDSSTALSETLPPGETQADMPERTSTGNQVTIVSVFQDAGRAHLAMAALQGAGIRPDQMQYSLPSFPASRFHDDLIALGLSQEEASFYSQVFEQGGTIVLVRAPASQQQDLLTLLRHYGASDARIVSQPVPASSTPATTAGAATDQSSVQLREERLLAHKQPVQVGEVHVGKDVIRELQTREVPVAREEVVIKRHAVDHQPSPTPIGPGGIYCLPLLAEDVHLEKQAVVGEELVVGKRVVQETQQVSDTVRREEARIERVGEVNIQGDDVEDDPSHRQGAS